jgi:hypothetical protein
LIGKQALPDGCLTGINTGSLDIDKNLPRARRGALDIDNLQHIDSAILIKPDCFGHASTPSFWIFVFDE